MSQFACPLCGKNSSIKQYDPDELDQDLKVVTYGSTGRGGIYVADKASILGNGDPLEQAVAGRALKVTKMFLDAGVLKREQLTTGLGLLVEKTEKQDPLKYARTMSFILNVEERNELEQNRKRRAEEREIKNTLLKISKLCNCELHLTEDLEITLRVIDTAKHDLELMEYFESMVKVKRDKVLRRITSEDPEIQYLLELATSLPEKLNIMEKLIDSDFVMGP